MSELGSATGERLEALAGDVVALSAAFAKHERYERAGQLCETVLARVAAVDEPWAPPLQVRARVRLGYAEARRGRLAESMDAFESIFDVGEGALPVLSEMADNATGQDGQLNAHAAWALLVRAMLLAHLGRTDDASAELANLREHSTELGATAIGHAIAQIAEQAQAELDADAGRSSGE